MRVAHTFFTKDPNIHRKMNVSRNVVVVVMMMMVMMMRTTTTRICTAFLSWTHAVQMPETTTTMEMTNR
jgi:hypothetical protein